MTTVTPTAHQACTVCVMDTSDPDIVFDSNGQCNHCLAFAEQQPTSWFRGEEGERKLQVVLDTIKDAGRGKEFDCILGLSGGVDSSYVALKAHDWGLRPLIVHVDAGWNSELAVQNIERIIRYTGFELHTHVVDWNAMRNLQLAYLRSGVSNQDVPQDHAFAAGVYRFAIENRVKVILNGGNFATEGIFPASWHGSAMDARNLKAIFHQFGTGSLEGYDTVSFNQLYFRYPILNRMRTVRPLNYMPYSKDIAVNELSQRLGWRNYGRKHGESLFTRFFQNYYLPQRYGFDKRRPHLSSRIAAGEISREAAVRELGEQLYDPTELERDKSYICRKLRISPEELEGFLRAPTRHHLEFANWDRRFGAMKRVQRLGERVSGRRVTVYG